MAQRERPPGRMSSGSRLRLFIAAILVVAALAFHLVIASEMRSFAWGQWFRALILLAPAILLVRGKRTAHFAAPAALAVGVYAAMVAVMISGAERRILPAAFLGLSVTYVLSAVVLLFTQALSRDSRT